MAEDVLGAIQGLFSTTSYGYRGQVHRGKIFHHGIHRIKHAIVGSKSTAYLSKLYCYDKAIIRYIGVIDRAADSFTIAYQCRLSNKNSDGSGYNFQATTTWATRKALLDIQIQDDDGNSGPRRQTFTGCAKNDKTRDFS
jgi:hypothetical protein